MKASILNTEGKETKQIDLPSCFNDEVRYDIIKRAYEVENRAMRQAFGNYLWAGMQQVAQGSISHRRRKYKTAYGYTLARVPRKVMSRHGGRFNWVGAGVSGTVGGREAHPPITDKRWARKINKKERAKAVRAALAATANMNELLKKYSLLNEEKEKIKNIHLPIIVESGIENIKKTKELKEILEKILGSLAKVAFRQRKPRAGKGKTRGRYHKIPRGMLLISEKKIDAAKGLEGQGFDNIIAGSLSIEQLAPSGIPGRLVVYTENAINAIKNNEKLK